MCRAVAYFTAFLFFMSYFGITFVPQGWLDALPSAVFWAVWSSFLYVPVVAYQIAITVGSKRTHATLQGIVSSQQEMFMEIGYNVNYVVGPGFCYGTNSYIYLEPTTNHRNEVPGESQAMAIV